MEKTNTTYTPIGNLIHHLPEIERKRNGFLKAMFGSRYALTYRPTGAAIKTHTETYGAELAEEIQHIVCTGMTDDMPDLAPRANGNVMLQAYISGDHGFCAIQVLRFMDFEYSPVTETHVYTGDKAQEIISKITGRA
ncbi:MAG: hypothetical protein K2G12_10735 [Prevotella sp.]|nr:hypothetical protein [Prevotella sp.]